MSLVFCYELIFTLFGLVLWPGDEGKMGTNLFRDRGDTTEISP